MTALVARAGQLDARAADTAAGYRVEFFHDWKQAIARWHHAGASMLFQDRRWLEAWYEAFTNVDGVEPLIVIISDAATADQVALLPLIRRLQNGIRVIEFADLELTDYNAPLLGTAAPREATAARALWRDLLAALRRIPGGADLVRLRKMPIDPGGKPNPLTLIDAAQISSLNGNVVTIGDDFDAYRYSLERTVRKELERSWRVFTRDPRAAFQIVTGGSRGAAHPIDDGSSAGCPNAEPRVELHSQRGDLRRVLSVSCR